LLLSLNQTEIIQEIAKNNPYMVSADLSSRGIADGHTRQLAEALKTNNVIRRIALRNNGLIDESFIILIDVIKVHPSLKMVDITGVNSLSSAVKERLRVVLAAKAGVEEKS
jgi:UDP-N-acetylglucosamine transferase subunit ALG13